MSAPGSAQAELLRAAARAIHGERDRDRMAAWTAEAIATAVGAGVAGLCLLADPGPPFWATASSSARDLAVLGDPRTYPELAAALSGERSTSRADEHLRRALGVARLELLPVPRADGGVHGVAVLGWPRADDRTGPGRPDDNAGVGRPDSRAGLGRPDSRAGVGRPDSRASSGPAEDSSELGGADDSSGPGRANDHAGAARGGATNGSGRTDGSGIRVAEALAAHLGVALDNQEAMADLEAVQRDVVHKLQEAVRPPTPAVPQTELGVYYLAADQRASTGGDLYDWIMLPSGELHLTVVDVMGKGVAATKDAIAVTHAVRLLVLDGCPLERVIARADALVTAQNPDLVATVIVGRYDPSTGLLRLAGGGHPPALLVTSDAVHQIAAGGIPIGFPGAGSEGEVSLTLARSDTVIFYTDGLIESTKDILKGLESLLRHARETASYPATSLARALVDRALEGAVRNDDSLALVLRRRSPPTADARTPLAPLEYRFTPTTAAVPLARHFLEDWLVRIPVDQGEMADLLLVASELCANAVHHASGQRGSVAMRASVEGPDIVIEVEDDGGNPAQLPDPGDELPEPLAERGRGLFLVRALVDSIESTVVDGHTLVRVRRRAVVARKANPP